MDKRAQMKCALRKATEQGLAAGRAQGLAQGLAEGRAKIIEMARNFKKAGSDIELISQCTGLSVEEINAL
ncbi:MAG: hypothetical protein MJY74_07565, partial [Bacteroidaceae bacterium]|nr:hypothetical protein [Bacteroidaceae bacterium]